MATNAGANSLYATDTELIAAGTDPRPDPGTTFTHAVETVDNDRAALLLEAGVVR